jgi:hypothetical protein
MKKLAKIAAGIGTAASTFYWVTLPALAGDETVNLCPPQGSGKPKPPGCLETGVSAEVSTANIIRSAVNLLLFVAFVVALIFLVIGGIRWVLSGGDKEGAGKAKETVTAALVGLAVVLGAWILISIILNFFGIPGGLVNLIVPTLQWQKVT